MQDQLIVACKNGDEKTVKALLQQGAKPDIANAKGEQPLGAAVWGMCPNVVNALLKQAGGIAPMTWQECEQHNKKYYNNEAFIISKFDPQTFGEWNDLLQKMDPNLFLRTFHLKEADEMWNDQDTMSWDRLRRFVTRQTMMGNERWNDQYALDNVHAVIMRTTEQEYVGFRSQIKRCVETAKQPTVALNF